MEDPGAFARFWVRTRRGQRGTVFSRFARLLRARAVAPAAAEPQTSAWWVFAPGNVHYISVDATDRETAWAAACKVLFGPTTNAAGDTRVRAQYAIVPVRAEDIAALQEKWAELVDAAKRALSCDPSDMPAALSDLALALEFVPRDSPADDPSAG